MKVLLVSFFNDEAYGIRAIHSKLINDNVDAYMLFFKLPRDHSESQNDKAKGEFIANLNNASIHEIDLLVDHIRENKYDIVGFSLVSQHFSLYKRIYERIRNIDHMAIVIGGWQSSLNPEDSIDYTEFLCTGEGEEPMSELVKKLENKEQTDNIKNFWVRTNNSVIKNPIRPLTRDLSSFPVPLFEHKYSYIIENNKLINNEPYFNNTRYGTFIGRGCPYKCTYCSNSYMANVIYPGQWSKVRHRSIYHVQKELLVVKEKLKRVKSINFYDEVFTPKMEWIKQFFSWYREVINIPFYAFFFPGTCNDEKGKILADSGLSGVWIGVQSGSQRVRNDIFKRFYTNERVLNQAKIFHQYGVSVRYDFILDNPFETFEESLESIYMMLELPQPFSLNLFSLKYFPNTEITNMAIDAGFINKSDIDDNQEKDRDTYLINKDKGSLDDRFINDLAFYISNMSDNSILQDRKSMILGLVDDYKTSKDITQVESMIQPFLD